MHHWNTHMHSLSHCLYLILLQALFPEALVESR